MLAMLGMRHFKKLALWPIVISAISLGWSTASPAAMPPQNCDEIGEAGKIARASIRALTQMARFPNMLKMLGHAKGVFVVPDYGRQFADAACPGGLGVLLARAGASWSVPAFYKIGGVQAGPQNRRGSVILILNTRRAVEALGERAASSLPSPGEKVLAWYDTTHDFSSADAIVWANSDNLIGDLAPSITDIAYSAGDTSAYDQVDHVRLKDVLDGSGMAGHTPLNDALDRLASDGAALTSPAYLYTGPRIRR